MALTTEQREAFNHYLAEAEVFQRRLYGKVRIIIHPDSDLHLRNWLIDGSTRAGKTVSLWFVAWLYYTLLKFKIVIFDYPSREGANINEPGFFSLPMPEKHPLFKKVQEVHGGPRVLPTKIFRPMIFTPTGPVGLGIAYKEEEVPANVYPFTLPFSQLALEDWKAILGNMSHTAENLLGAGIRLLAGEREASILDLIRMIDQLSEEEEIRFRADLAGLPAGTPEVKIGSRAFDKKSVPRLHSNLENLVNSGFILPEFAAGEKVGTNVDVKTLVRENDWLVFNFSPAIPQSLVFGTIQFIVRQLLWIQDKDKYIAMVFPEVSQFGPRQIPEGRGWFLQPLRDLLIVAATQHAKNGKIVLADTQHPSRLDETLVESFHYRLHFSRPGKGDLEDAVRSDGVINAESLLSPQNLRLVLDERNHYPIFVMPTKHGCIVKGDAVPPFRTHVTAEGTYDMVYKNSKDRPPMKSLMPDIGHLVTVVEQSHIRSANIQAEEEKVQVAEEITKMNRTKLLVLAHTKLMCQQHGHVTRLKEWLQAMEDKVGIKETALHHYLRQFRNEGMYMPTGSARDTQLSWVMEKLGPFNLPPPSEEPVTP